MMGCGFNSGCGVNHVGVVSIMGCGFDHVGVVVNVRVPFT